MRKRNIFGGENPHSNYVPLTDIEREALGRLVQSGDIVVQAEGFGDVHITRVQVGDANFHVYFDFSPELPAPVAIRHLDLALKTQAGMPIYKSRMPINLANGEALTVGGEVTSGQMAVYSMVWSISIRHMDPKLVKTLKPGAIGLTSRRLDKDTGAATFAGNMKLTKAQKRALQLQSQGEAILKAEHAKLLKAAKNPSGLVLLP